MKEQNFVVKFKNSFARTDLEKVSAQSTIIKDSLSNVATAQLTSLIELYTRDIFQNGFNPYLAFRIIILYCYSTVQQNKIQNFDLKNQINRFLNHHLSQQHLQHIQQCLDLLIVDQVRRKVSPKYYKLFKIKVLSYLNKYYLYKKQSKDRKKSTNKLRQLCKQALKNQKIKHHEQIYCQILDILVDLETREYEIKIRKNKKFQAMEFINNIIRYLQNTQYSLSKVKYQQKLMNSYWICALLHYQLHYIIYTKKYCQIVINIAKRLQNQDNIKSLAQQLLQKVIL